jgi:hypothetical protein
MAGGGTAAVMSRYLPYRDQLHPVRNPGAYFKLGSNMI